jgi:hypothetical protein
MNVMFGKLVDLHWTAMAQDFHIPACLEILASLLMRLTTPLGTFLRCNQDPEQNIRGRLVIPLVSLEKDAA